MYHRDVHEQISMDVHEWQIKQGKQASQQSSAAGEAAGAAVRCRRRYRRGHRRRRAHRQEFLHDRTSSLTQISDLDTSPYPQGPRVKIMPRRTWRTRHSQPSKKHLTRMAFPMFKAQFLAAVGSADNCACVATPQSDQTITGPGPAGAGSYPKQNSVGFTLPLQTPVTLGWPCRAAGPLAQCPAL